jgi:hypothetical protein
LVEVWRMAQRPWLFDIEIICPLCGEHKMKYSNMSCPKRREQLNEKYFIMLKFTELEYKIKELSDKFENEREKLENTDKEEHVC